MEKVGIKFSHSSILEWLDYVYESGDKLGRTLCQRRMKFLDKFPESFQIIVTPDRMSPPSIPDKYVCISFSLSS